MAKSFYFEDDDDILTIQESGLIDVMRSLDEQEKNTILEDIRDRSKQYIDY